MPLPTSPNLTLRQSLPLQPQFPPPTKSRLQALLQQLTTLQTKFPQPTKEFTLFPKLPTELRFRIWFYIAHVPRDIKVLSRWPNDKPLNSTVKGQHWYPPILHASHESRHEGLRYYEERYQKCYESYWPQSSIGNESKHFHGSIIFVNFSVDRFVVEFGPRTDFAEIDDYNLDYDTLLEINHLAITEHPVRLRLISKQMKELIYHLNSTASLTFIIPSWRFNIRGTSIDADFIRRDLATEERRQFGSKRGWMKKLRWKGKKRDCKVVWQGRNLPSEVKIKHGL